jgi:hypothetical protein
MTGRELTKTGGALSGEGFMKIKKIIKALIAGGLIATAFLEWRKVRETHRRARRIMYPGSTGEMVAVLAELKRHRDPESQILTRQLEDHLKGRDERAWRRARH